MESLVIERGGKPDALAYSGGHDDSDCRLRRPMTAPTVSGSDEWTTYVRLIHEKQDREAFAAIFRHFAPRVKAFLLRSGTGDGRNNIRRRQRVLVGGGEIGRRDVEHIESTICRVI